MHKLAFGVLEFDEEKIQTTCRSGTKWFEQVNVGDIVAMTDRHGNPLGRNAQIVFQDICHFDNIPGLWVEMNHDEAARSRAGLEAAMNAAYGTGEWNRDEVTILGFAIVT